MNSFQIELVDVPTKKPRITAVVDEEMQQYLEEWANEEERTLSNLVVVILKQAIEARKQAKASESK